MNLFRLSATLAFFLTTAPFAAEEGFTALFPKDGTPTGWSVRVDNYPWPSHDDDTKLAIGGTLLFIGNGRVVVNIICSGMLERYPELKIVSVESGAGWVPFILEALDYEMAENAPKLRDETLSMSPTEYFRRQIYATMWFERADLPSLVKAVGEDNILFETDFPHPTCLYPDPLGSADESMRELTQEQRNKILGGNAQQLYRL